MSGTGNRDWLIADAAERAATQVEQEADLGELQWAIGGRRCYVQKDDEGFTLTIVAAGGSRLVNRIEGVDFDKAFPPMQ